MTFGGALRVWRLLAATFVAAGIVGLFADSAAAAPNKYASIVVDAQSGRVLYARNADARRYPASTTKIMTLYLLFEALERGEVTLNQRFRVSRHAAQQPPSKLGLRAGDTIRVGDAMLALVTKSANDVAAVVAEGLGKTESNFARKMTAKARKLGMAKTTFRNASGLPDPRQVTTARDMARLGQAVFHHFPRYYQHFSRQEFTYRGVTYGNHNRLLGSYDGMDGIKTGYIRDSGYNLVASARRGHQRLIGVVFGGKSSNSRNAHMVELLDDGFAKHALILEAQAKRRGRVLARIDAPPPKPQDSAVVGLGVPSTAAAAVASIGGASIGGASIGGASIAGASIAGDWGIQVGAFREQHSASNAARTAYVNASEFVQRGKVAVVQYSDGDREPFYLARIHDLDKGAADQACRKLESAGTDCFQLQVEKDGEQEERTSAQWGVQVGAYPQHASAYMTAKKAVEMVPASLNQGVIKVMPLNSGRTPPLFRGRVLGISKHQAEQACMELKAHRMACMVLRPQGLG